MDGFDSHTEAASTIFGSIAVRCRALPLRGEWPQANTWSELSPSGGPPAARDDCTAVGSDAADGFYIFGGFDDSPGAP